MNKNDEAIAFLTQDTAFTLAGLDSRRQRASRAAGALERARASAEHRGARRPVLDALTDLARNAARLERGIIEKIAVLEQNLAELQAMQPERKGARRGSLKETHR